MHKTENNQLVDNLALNAWARYLLKEYKILREKWEKSVKLIIKAATERRLVCEGKDDYLYLLSRCNELFVAWALWYGRTGSIGMFITQMIGGRTSGRYLVVHERWTIWVNVMETVIGKHDRVYSKQSRRSPWIAVNFQMRFFSTILFASRIQSPDSQPWVAWVWETVSYSLYLAFMKFKANQRMT